MCTSCHAKEIGKAPMVRTTAIFATHIAPSDLIGADDISDTSHDDLLRLISHVDEIREIRTIQWILGRLDRRYAAVWLQTVQQAELEQ